MAVEVDVPFDVLVQDVEKAGVEILHLGLVFEMIKIVLSKNAEFREEIVVGWGDEVDVDGFLFHGLVVSEADGLAHRRLDNILRLLELVLIDSLPLFRRLVDLIGLVIVLGVVVGGGSSPEHTLGAFSLLFFGSVLQATISSGLVRSPHLTGYNFILLALAAKLDPLGRA